jgi:hypothetical protein
MFTVDGHGDKTNPLELSPVQYRKLVDLYLQEEEARAEGKNAKVS